MSTPFASLKCTFGRFKTGFKNKCADLDWKEAIRPKWGHDIFSKSKKSTANAGRLPLMQKWANKIHVMTKGWPKKGAKKAPAQETSGLGVSPSLEAEPVLLPAVSHQPIPRKQLSQEASDNLAKQYNDLLHSSLPNGLLPKPNKILSEEVQEQRIQRLKAARLEPTQMNALKLAQEKYMRLKAKDAGQLQPEDVRFIRDHEQFSGHMIQSYQLAEKRTFLGQSALDFGEEIPNGLICPRDKTMKDLSSRSILVNWELDPELAKNIHTIQKVLEDSPAKDDATKWRLIQNHVNQTFSVGTKNTRTIIQALPDGECYFLGDFIKEGVGACLERALLTKLIADKVGLEATLESGVLSGKMNHAWNTVKVSGKPIHLLDAQRTKFEPLTPELQKQYVQGMSMERYLELLNTEMQHADLDTLRRMQIMHLEVANRQNRTFLMRAACFGRSDIVEALLKAGKNPSARDLDGWTALDFLKEEKQEQLLQSGNQQHLEQLDRIEKMLQEALSPA